MDCYHFFFEARISLGWDILGEDMGFLWAGSLDMLGVSAAQPLALDFISGPKAPENAAFIWALDWNGINDF